MHGVLLACNVCRVQWLNNCISSWNLFEYTETDKPVFSSTGARQEELIYICAIWTLFNLASILSYVWSYDINFLSSGIMRGNSILFQLYTEDLDEILRFFFTRNIRIQRLNPFRIHTDIRVGKNFSQLFLGIQKKKKKLESTYYACNIVSSRLTTPRLISLVAVSNPLTSHYSFG